MDQHRGAEAAAFRSLALARSAPQRAPSLSETISARLSVGHKERVPSLRVAAIVEYRPPASLLCIAPVQQRVVAMSFFVLNKLLI